MLLFRPRKHVCWGFFPRVTRNTHREDEADRKKKRFIIFLILVGAIGAEIRYVCHTRWQLNFQRLT